MAPWGGGSELGGGDEGCVSAGGGKGRGGEGADGGASGRGTVDFGEGGEGGEGVPAEMVGGILGGDGGGRPTGGDDDCTATCDPQLAQSAQKHVSKQMPLPGGELAVGIGSGWRMPQSAPSVPYWPSGYSAPGPPSSQQPSEASAGIPMRVTVLMQRAGGAAGAGGVDARGRGGLETGGCGGERGMSGAQSTQSAPYAHIGNSEPGLSQ